MTESLTAEESEAVLVALTNRVSANLPLHTALTALAEESSSPQAKRVLREMDRRLQAGESPENVIASLHERLPAAVGNLLQGGLEIGRLDLVMQFLVNQKQWDREFRHRMTIGFAYPTVVGSLFGGWVLFVLLVIVPQFKLSYADFGAELPGATMLLIELSDLLLHGGYWLVVALVAVVIGGWRWLCFGNVSAFFSRTGVTFPIIGSMVTLRQFSEFCDVLAILLEGQLELPKALRLASGGLSDPVLQTTCQDLAERIERGESIASAANRMELPHAFCLVLRQSLPESARELRSLAHVYNTKGDSSIRMLTTAVDITVMMGVSIMIVLTLFGLFMPLIKLLNDLS
jgi:type II secretory pathway component PulF